MRASAAHAGASLPMFARRRVRGGYNPRARIEAGNPSRAAEAGITAPARSDVDVSKSPAKKAPARSKAAAGKHAPRQACSQARPRPTAKPAAKPPTGETGGQATGQAAKPTAKGPAKSTAKAATERLPPRPAAIHTSQGPLAPSPRPHRRAKPCPQARSCRRPKRRHERSPVTRAPPGPRHLAQAIQQAAGQPRSRRAAAHPFHRAFCAAAAAAACADRTGRAGARRPTRPTRSWPMPGRTRPAAT